MPNHQELLARYAAGAQRLRQATAGMSDEQAAAHPVPGKWSTLEVACHLADMETVFTERMKRVLIEDRPNLPNADENAYASALAYDRRSLADEVAVVEATRRQMLRILGSLPEAAFARAGIHSTAGPLSLEQLLDKVTWHLEHHVKFIDEKRQALGLA
jgi:hypothetical protein